MLVIVALGVLFDARLIRDKAVLTTLALRILLGLAWDSCACGCSICTG